MELILDWLKRKTTIVALSTLLAMVIAMADKNLDVNSMSDQIAGIIMMLVTSWSASNHAEKPAKKKTEE